MGNKKILKRWIKNIAPFKAAVAAVAVSVVASVLVSAVSESGKNIISSEMDAMGLNGIAAAVYNKKGENKTDVDFYNSIANMEKILSATPVLTEKTEITFANGTVMETMGWGINEQAADIVSLDITHGRMICEDDIKSNAFVCLIDENIADKVYKRSNICGKRIYVHTGENTVPFTIVGMVRKGSNVLNSFTAGLVPDFIYMPYTTMKSLSSKGGFDQIIFTSENTGVDIPELKEKLNESSRYRTQTISFTNLSQQKEQIDKIVDTAFISLFLVSCVAVLVCSISVASSVNTAVIAKHKDIGIKMSMGAGRSDIAAEFIISAVISCFLGISIAFFLVIIAAASLGRFFDIWIKFDCTLIAVTVSVTIVLTAIFSFLPSFRAAEMPPIRALNRE